MSIEEKVLPMELADLIGDRFGDYSKYVISSRAIPDARDGLKPVQRRILYTMFDEGNTPDKPYRKSARTVGSVMGRFHPHGDSSIYQALVTMAQPFQKRHVLIDGHGNFGSMDDDPAAAMRYTEARLSLIAMELLRDIKKNTVDFLPNFDNTEDQPSVLPARFPNLLINGVQGIASGFATNIPTHNLGEIITAAIHYIDHPQMAMDELMEIVPGPDFPTGGVVIGRDGIRQAYDTGKGSFHIRAAYTVEPIKGGRQQIVITELPYQVIKQNLVNIIEEIRLNKRVEGIAEVRDETDRNSGQARCRVVIELKKEADTQSVLGYLLQKTDLQISFGMNLVAIVEGAPKQLSILQALDAYIKHQIVVIRRRTEFELSRAKERAHIVQGYVKALNIIDEIIATIKGSDNRSAAQQNLIAKFGFSVEQSDAILTLQLYRLTNLEIHALEKELAQLQKFIAGCESTLSSEKKLLGILKTELAETRDRFASARMTKIQDEMEKIKVNLEAIVAAEDVFVTFTREGYIKRVPKRSFSRSGGELETAGVKENDRIEFLIETTTIDTLYLFTAGGQSFRLPVHLIPEFKWKDPGAAIVNVLPIEKTDRVVSIVVAPKQEDRGEQFVMLFTKQGMCKRTTIVEYETKRTTAIAAIGLKEHDEVIAAIKTHGEGTVLVTTHFGKTLHFGEHEINVIGRAGSGVKAIKVQEGDFVVSAAVAIGSEYHYVVFSHRGIAKRTPIVNYTLQSRAGKGLSTIKEYKRNPHQIIAAFLLPQSSQDANEPTVTACTTSKGRLLLIEDQVISVQKREDMGVSIADDLLLDETVVQVIRTQKLSS
ncbi:MAG: subunit of gyrase [Bacilli bacterium]|nr:subunit of gyrase [Bacilli bacterium]